MDSEIFRVTIKDGSYRIKKLDLLNARNQIWEMLKELQL